MPMERVRRVLLGAVGIALVVISLSGWYLGRRYFPAGRGRSGAVDAAISTHRIAAWVLVVLLVVLVIDIARLVWARDAARRGALVIGGFVAIGAALVAIARGARLAWDQLALWAVVDGIDNAPRGVWLPEQVKYVLRGATEVAPGDFRDDVWLHVAVLPLVLLAGIGTLIWASRAAPQNAMSSNVVADSTPHS